jgi:hypothetical protein
MLHENIWFHKQKYFIFSKLTFSSTNYFHYHQMDLTYEVIGNHNPNPIYIRVGKRLLGTSLKLWKLVIKLQGLKVWY